MEQLKGNTNQKDMKKDFEGFPQEDITKGRQKRLDSHLSGFPLPWPVDLKDTNFIMDCVISSIERKLELETQAIVNKKVTVIKIA